MANHLNEPPGAARQIYPPGHIGLQLFVSIPNPPARHGTDTSHQSRPTPLLTRALPPDDYAIANTAKSLTSPNIADLCMLKATNRSISNITDWIGTP